MNSNCPCLRQEGTTSGTEVLIIVHGTCQQLPLRSPQSLEMKDEICCCLTKLSVPFPACWSNSTLSFTKLPKHDALVWPNALLLSGLRLPRPQCSGCGSRLHGARTMPLPAPPPPGREPTPSFELQAPAPAKKSLVLHLLQPAA